MLEDVILSKRKKYIKTLLKGILKESNYKAGFVATGLSFYAYELWELIVRDELGDVPTKEQVFSLSNNHLSALAIHLDKQFLAEGRADSIGYLKLTLG